MFVDAFEAADADADDDDKKIVIEGENGLYLCCRFFL